MSFCQNNETIRKWNAFYQANRELIARIGLPGPTVDTWDRFADLLMHGYIDHHDDPSKFFIEELTPDRYALFKELVDMYFGAGFSDPGMHHVIVGGMEEWVTLVKKYPKQFSPYSVESANEWNNPSEQE